MKAYLINAFRYKGSGEAVYTTVVDSLKDLPAILWAELNHGCYVEVLNMDNNKGIRFDSTNSGMVEYAFRTGNVSKFKDLLGDFKKIRSPIKKTAKKTVKKTATKRK